MHACAGLWRAVTTAFAEGRPHRASARSAIAEVLCHERAALDAIDSVDIGEPACAA